MTSGRKGRKWSAKAAETSDGPDLESGIFRPGNPRRIAGSLKRSAGHSRRRKAAPFQSAMSMLTSTSIGRSGPF